MPVVMSACHEVELVAFGVDEADPPIAVLGQRPDLLGAQGGQAVGFDLDVGGLQVEVDPVLDGLGLGNLVKHQEGSAPAVGIGGDRREVLSGAVVDGAVQGLGPEVRESGGVDGVDADSQYRDTHMRPLCSEMEMRLLSIGIILAVVGVWWLRSRAVTAVFIANWAETFMAGTGSALVADGRACSLGCDRLEHHDRDVATGCLASVLGKMRPEPLGDYPVVPLLVAGNLAGSELLDAGAV